METIYVLTDWTRGTDGNETQLGLECEANGWPARITDVTDQPGPEIKVGHGALVELECEAATLDSVRNTGHYTFLEKQGELTEKEKTELAKHVEEIALLPANTPRDTVKQLLVERFREQGPRDILKEAAKDALREVAADTAGVPREPRPR